MSSREPVPALKAVRGEIKVLTSFASRVALTQIAVRSGNVYSITLAVGLHNFEVSSISSKFLPMIDRVPGFQNWHMLQ